MGPGMAKELGARQQGGWKVIGSLPDVCKTPMGSSTPPVPYPVYAELSTAKDIARSVRSNGSPLVIYDESFTPQTIGDAAGMAKGVSSGTVQGKCYPAAHSGTVRAEGCWVVRHGDRFEMNAP
jgi:hypothetical protein